MQNNDEQGVLPPGCVYQTGGETGQGPVTAPVFFFSETGQDALNRIQTHQSDRIKYEIIDSMRREEGYYNREVRGQWNSGNTIYHESSEQIRFRRADQTRTGYDDTVVPGVFATAGGVGPEGNFGYQGHRVHPIQLQTNARPENPVYGRPFYTDQGIANYNYEHQTQRDHGWITNPERRDNPSYTCTENCAPADTDRSLDQWYRANQYGAVNGTVLNNETLHWRPDHQDWNSMDITLDLSTNRHPTTTQFTSAYSVVPESHIQYANHFGNLPGPTGNANYTDPGFNIQDWRPRAQDWNSLDITLDLSMNKRETKQLTSGHYVEPDNQMRYVNSVGNLPGPFETANSYIETLDLRLSALDWNSPDVTLDLSMNRQATNEVTGDHSVVSDSQIQYANCLQNLPVPSGTVNYTDSYSENLDCRHETEDWDLLDIPLDLTIDLPATDEFVSDHRELRALCSNSSGTLPGPSGTANPEILSRNSESASSVIENDLPLKRRRRRHRLLEPPEEAPNAKPKTKRELLQQILENKLLAGFRPILPRPPEITESPKVERNITDEEDLDAMRKRRRGWKCECLQTFDDFNLYKCHVESAHRSADAASTSRGTNSRKKAPPSSKSKANMCPFCLTNHETLRSDITTETCCDDGSDLLLCPLCSRPYKTLRELKIHYCVHFQVKVAEEDNLHLCRYCDEGFVRESRLRRHEADCMVAHAAKQNCEVEESQNQSAAEVAESTASPATPAAYKGAATVADTTSAPETSTATAANESTAASIEAIATESTAAEGEAPPVAAKTASESSSDERLFYCPDCGKLFTWAGSVRRHQQTSHASHANSGRKLSRPRSSKESRQSPAGKSSACCDSHVCM